MWPSIVALSAMAVVALWLTISRGGVCSGAAEARRAARVAAVAVAAQAGHFAEELATGFHVRVPATFDLEPLPPALFVSFNLVWLGIWALSVRGLAGRHRAALFPLWFLGVAAVANGVLHPLLAVRDGGYFPGLFTSPVMGLVGVWLLVRLLRVTA